VEQSFDSTGYQLEHENIEVLKDIDREIPKRMVDPVQIQQVFTNMILNAEQAITSSSEQGQLSVSTGLNGDGAIEIAFTDNGPG
jgi:signal transduction histidine kinase